MNTCAAKTDLKSRPSLPARHAIFAFGLMISVPVFFFVPTLLLLLLDELASPHPNYHVMSILSNQESLFFIAIELLSAIIICAFLLAARLPSFQGEMRPVKLFPAIEDPLRQSAIDVGIPPPDEIVLTHDSRISLVTLHRSRRSQLPKTVIIFGRANLLLFDDRDFHIAFTHELVHSCLRHRRIPAYVTNKIRSSVSLVLDGITGFFSGKELPGLEHLFGIIPYLLFYWHVIIPTRLYWWTFSALIAHLQRREELIVDRYAADLIGHQIYCQSLVRIISLQGATKVLMTEFGDFQLDGQSTYTDWLLEFGKWVQENKEHTENVLTRVKADLLKESTAVFDEHPCLAERLQELNGLEAIACCNDMPVRFDRVCSNSFFQISQNGRSEDIQQLWSSSRQSRPTKEEWRNWRQKMLFAFIFCFTLAGIISVGVRLYEIARRFPDEPFVEMWVYRTSTLFVLFLILDLVDRVHSTGRDRFNQVAGCFRLLKWKVVPGRGQPARLEEVIPVPSKSWWRRPPKLWVSLGAIVLFPSMCAGATAGVLDGFGLRMNYDFGSTAYGYLVVGWTVIWILYYIFRFWFADQKLP